MRVFAARPESDGGQRRIEAGLTRRELSAIADELTRRELSAIADELLPPVRAP
jgi:hypothetical protein